LRQRRQDDSKGTPEAPGKPRAGISIVGAGNWGSSLAAAAVAAGIPLLEVVVRRAKDRRRRFGPASVVLSAEARWDAELIWICVPDDEISGVAAEIASLRPGLRGQTVVHSSGALSVEALAAVKQAGAAVGGIAPVFSFPTREPVRLEGVMFVVEAGSEAQRRRLNSLVRRLRGRPLRVDSGSKAMYHAAATMASPLMVSAAHAAVAAARLAGLDRADAEAVVKALAIASLGNYFARGAERSFSGAFARGDAETVELHLRALLAHPRLHGIYVQLAGHAIGSFSVKNRVDLERSLDA
jgi:predicted short-subunit dehydrogenase-like oxidoreductase (DUF2520 family)